MFNFASHRSARTCISLSLLFTPPVMANSDVGSFATHYADLALAKYEDSLTSARALGDSVERLIAEPSAETLNAARQSWLDARIPYQQTEAFRFGNAIVDDWEGRVNAWPLDEGLIDYVDTSFYGSESDLNDLYAANVVANENVMVGGELIDASVITPELLSGTLHEASGNEANVATGYHAIEFLLWGQDLNFTDAGAGERPYTDYSAEQCTNGNCERRAQYLQAAAQLLITDLEEMVGNWTDSGVARLQALSLGDNAVKTAMLTGLGSLSYGELAGERMRLGLMLHDPEEEHDCFSDNTHNSHFYDALGIKNLYTGNYTRIDGQVVSGSSLSEAVQKVDASLDEEMRKHLDQTMQAMQIMVDRAESIEAYDQMISEGNIEGNAVVQTAIDALVTQTRSIERIVQAMKLPSVTIEGSDSLDDPESVFQ